VHLRDLLGVSLDELRELIAAEDARAALRREWRRGVEDPVRRREILDVALAHVDRQLGLVRRQASDRSELIGRLGLEQPAQQATRQLAAAPRSRISSRAVPLVCLGRAFSVSS
jgi:hypothetical protein